MTRIMKYGILELELKQTRKVKSRLLSLGYSESDLNGKKIIYLSSMVFSEEEQEEIIQLINSNDRDSVLDRIHLRQFAHAFKKVKYLRSRRWLSNSKIQAFLNRDAALQSDWGPDEILLPSLNQNKYTVYALYLSLEVLEKVDFQKANPNYKPNMPCFYVGQTSKLREQRFQDHLSGGRTSSKWVKSFRISPMFEDSNATNFISSLFPDDQIDNLYYGQSLFMEDHIAEKLRDKGYGVWFN